MSFHVIDVLFLPLLPLFSSAFRVTEGLHPSAFGRHKIRLPVTFTHSFNPFASIGRK